MKYSKLGLLLSCVIFSAASVAAPVQVSSFGNLPADREVNGFHGSFLYSDTGTVSGFDLPILGYSEMDQLNGFQLGLVSGSHIRNGMNGVAVGLFNWHGGYDQGVNFSLANQVNDIDGVNLGIYSGATGTVHGVSLGAVTTSGNMNGLNVGAIANYTTGYVKGLNIAPFNWTEKKLMA